jgi:hypothetical protein
MPLEFESISHGKIAFGFFNIETDMILLNHYFLFAEDFCHHIGQASKEKKDAYEAAWEVYVIKPEDIGNLMGAIYGMDHGGFIGEVYRLFPFPKNQKDFKQKPEGFKTRSVMEALVQRYSKKISIPVVFNHRKGEITIGEYGFSRVSFHELIRYIWAGGFPRWKDGIRPDYVLAIKEKIDLSESVLLDGLVLS